MKSKNSAIAVMSAAATGLFGVGVSELVSEQSNDHGPSNNVQPMSPASAIHSLKDNLEHGECNNTIVILGNADRKAAEYAISMGQIATTLCAEPKTSIVISCDFSIQEQYLFRHQTGVQRPKMVDGSYAIVLQESLLTCEDTDAVPGAQALPPYTGDSSQSEPIPSHPSQQQASTTY